MNSTLHLSTILILEDDNRFRALHHIICASAELAEKAAPILLSKFSEANPSGQHIHRTMPLYHVEDAELLKLNPYK